MAGWTLEMADLHEAKLKNKAAPVAKPATAVLRPGQGVKYASKTEAAYADYLRRRKEAGEIIAWWYEPWSANLRPDCRYTPDFMVHELSGILSMIDTKAERGTGGKKRVHIEQDALVRVKWACELFSCFRWLIAWQDKQTGEWMYRELEVAR